MVLPVLLAVATCAVLAGLMLGLQHWEFRRLVRNRLRDKVDSAGQPHAAIISPVKGSDIHLEQNLRPLFEQDYGSYEIVFAVESKEEPALRTIRALIASHPRVPAKIVVAGRSNHHGQKVHNLLAATADLSADVQVLAFVDADARPAKRWLKTLVYRLNGSATAAATGYRWLVPSRPTFPNHLVSSINAGAAAMLGRHEFNLIWGGSWAIEREKFDEIDLRAAWQRTLSDDLVASRVIRQEGLHIEFEPTCLCASPVDKSLGEHVEFVRRQFLIGKRYAPKYWLMTLILTTLTQVGFWGNALAAACLLAAGSWMGLLHGGVAGLLYGMSTTRALLRQDAARRRFPRFQSALASAARFDIVAGFLASSIAWAILLSSAIGSSVHWGGNRYRIRRGGEIQLLSRGGKIADAVVPAAGHGPGSATLPIAVRRRSSEAPLTPRT